MQVQIYSDANATLVNQAEMFSRTHTANCEVECIDDWSEWLYAVEDFLATVEETLDIEFSQIDIQLATLDATVFFLNGEPVAWVNPEDGKGFILPNIG